MILFLFSIIILVHAIKHYADFHRTADIRPTVTKLGTVDNKAEIWIYTWQPECQNMFKVVSKLINVHLVPDYQNWSTQPMPLK